MKPTSKHALGRTITVLSVRLAFLFCACCSLAITLEALFVPAPDLKTRDSRIMETMGSASRASSSDAVVAGVALRRALAILRACA